MIGQTLGRYRIDAKLGAGGMGVVYKAHDTQLGRTVAIKVLPPETVSDPDRKRRFVQEARAASALNHPNIVTIHDIGAEGDVEFIVMEHVSGTTLDRRIAESALPLKEALRFGIAMADALAKAHEAGIIHRDLKPSNVIVSDGGVVKILDFGIAKLREVAVPSAETKSIAATDIGAVVGTPAYMSPEQAEGRAIDARSDIFSFGSVLYEMVTGRQAFDGGSRLSVLGKVVNEEPIPPSQLSPTIPPDLNKTIVRCLRKDPARRYQTMADLKVVLEDLFEDSSRGATVTAPPPSAAAQSRPSRRWPWVAAIALAVVATVGYVVWQSVQLPVSDEPMHALPLTSLSGQVRFPTLSPDSNHVAFTWNGPQEDNQDIYVQQIGAGAPLRLTSDPASDSSPAWSPDGRGIAYLRRIGTTTKHEVRVVPPLGGTDRRIADIELLSPVYRPIALAWCPDSSCLVVPDRAAGGKADALFVIARDSGDKRQLTFPSDVASVDTDPAVSPDGRSLVFRRDLTPYTGEMHRAPLSAGVMPAGDSVRLTDYKVSATRPAWLPDSREIVFATRTGLWRLDAFGGGAPTRLPFVGLDGSAPAVSPVATNGRLRLVYVRVYSDTNVWRVDTSAAGVPSASPPRVVIASTRSDHLPNLSPDGTRVAFFSARSGEFELWVADPDGANATQLTTLKAVPGFARWSPDGRTLTFHSDPEGHPDVLTISANGGQPQILIPGTAGGSFPSFSRDGRSIYLAGRNANGDDRIMKVPASGGPAVAVTSSPGAVPIESYDGASLYYLEAAQRPSALWRVPVAGGAATRILDGVLNGAYDVAERGVYYLERVSGGSSGYAADRQEGVTRLRFFDFATRATTTVSDNLGAIAFGLSASRDGGTILFARVDSSADELMLVDGFR